MNKKLKVLLPVHVFFPKHFYGTETYTLELAQCLKQMGHDPVIITAIPFGEQGPGEILSTYEYKDIPVYSIDLNVIPYQRFKDTYYRPELYSIHKRIIAEVNPDIAHVTHLIHHTAIILEVLQEARVPAIATMTDFYGICFTNILQAYAGGLCHGPNRRSTNCLGCYLRISDHFAGRKRIESVIKNNLLLHITCALLPSLMKLPRFRDSVFNTYVADITQRLKILRRLYAHYHYLVAPTDFLYNAYRANDFHPEKIKKINFGIDQESVRGFQAPKKKTDAPVTFGYIGQIMPHKGVDLLVRAFTRIQGDNKSLLIYGAQDQDPSYMDTLSGLVAGEPRIAFRGTFPPEDLARRLSEIDILVIPSRWHENSPLVLLYALATKTPVLVSNARGMTEFVKDGVNGYIFRMDSLKELTRIMQSIVDNPTSISSLSENAAYDKDVSDHAADVFQLYAATLQFSEAPSP